MGETRIRQRFARNTNVDTGYVAFYDLNHRETARQYYVYSVSSRQYKSLDRCTDSTHPGPPFNSGGPLNIFHLHDNMDLRSVSVYSDHRPYEARYFGGFVCFIKPSAIGYSDASMYQYYQNQGGAIAPAGDFSSYGATGWNKFKPGRPTADIGVALGEAKDIPRMLRTSAKGFNDLWRSMGGSKTGFAPKSVANHWLNTQFGWIPFLSDVRKFYKTFKTLRSKLDRIKRNNGKWVLCGGTITESETRSKIASSATVTGHWPVLMTTFAANGVNSGSHEAYLVEKILAWFEGRFRYYIDNIESPLWEAKATAELFGLTPCPSLIWELTPWSWLVDWVSNAGDVFANMDTGYADNLAAKYAYVMGTRTWELNVNSTYNLKDGCLNDTWNYLMQVKSRTGANPFGFGLQWGDLSPRQLSILSALGVSRF